MADSMLSFSKLLLLAVVIGVVWFGWRWFNRVQAIGRERANRRDTASPRRRTSTAPGTTPGAAPNASTGPDTAMEVEDMEKCPECGAYVAPRSAVSCGRPACPYGR